ncbi:hypothetical protein [Oceanobacillus manasiensis]|uniref:hypothetical protein n=1 Tax=Oceanobacillus manasiensis TaxID=586413 RepID=UPI0005A6F22D|nr:hypothetical protein [Oceanobacillus manasiensis]
MAFGLKRDELISWKKKVLAGEIAILTHYWLDNRFPGCTSVTKVGCNDLEKLTKWGSQYGLEAEWVHRDKRFPHYDLFGERQRDVLISEKQWKQLEQFNLMNK